MPNLQDFVDLSVELTGFSDFILRGTGCAERYFSTVIDIAGQETTQALLAAFSTVKAQAAGDSSAMHKLLRTDILCHEKYGPIARNIIKLWYVSTWYELPLWWRDKFGPCANDRTYVVSPYAYPEGLLWVAIGAHPPGAKAPGYGTWIQPPQIPAHP